MPAATIACPEMPVWRPTASELWRLGSLGIGDLVLKLLNDSDPQVRLLAVTSAIRAPGYPEVQERLQAIALRDPVPEIRARAADAQRRTSKIDSLRHLIKHGRRDAEGA